jgi:hypothetical protein
VAVDNASRLSAFYSAARVVQARTRRRRMALFERVIDLPPSARVLDLGGTPSLWAYVKQPLAVTILNLPGNADESVATHHKVTFFYGDACETLPWADRAFDVVFSDSVIEHVGPEDRQAAFAENIKRLGRSYYVQTPAPWFPIEAHTGMPFWWFYPELVRRRILAHWRETLPAWADSMAGTRVLTRRRMRELFPGAELQTETLAGIPKSYTAFSRRA